MANAKESARTAYRVAGEVQFFHDVRSVSCIGDVDKGWDCKYRKDQVPRGTLATGTEPIGNVDEIDFSKVSSVVVKQSGSMFTVFAHHWGKRSLDCAVITQESISAPGITWKVLDCSPRKA
jgi:hypothetical protein